MKRILFYIYFILAYTGTVFSLYCLVSGRLYVIRFLLFVFSIALLAFMGDRTGRGGWYKAPGTVLFLIGICIFIAGFVSVFQFQPAAIIRGSLFIVYGFFAAFFGLFTANRL